MIDPSIPRALELILLKALDKDPDRRYQTAGEMAEDLRAFQDHRPISARGLPLLTRAERWYQRRRDPIRWIGTAGLIAAAALAIIFGFANQLCMFLFGPSRLG